MTDTRIPWLVGGAFLGAAIAIVSISSRSSGAVPSPVQNVAPASADSERSPEVVVPAGADAQLAAKLDEVLARLQRIETRMAEQQQPSRVAVNPPAAAAMLDADTVLAALELAEQRKIEQLSDPELRDHARRLSKEGQHAAAERHLRTLLDRPLSAEDRAQTQMELGIALRSRGDDQGRAAALAEFQAVVDTHGLGSALGSRAGYEMIWSYAKADANAAFAQTQALVTTPGVPTQIRRSARWAAGIVAQGLGDTARARTEYESLLREIDGQPEQAKLVADIRRRLGEL